MYAAKKAIISQQMRPGDSFPSVRALSRELKINPNTAHKVVANLISDGLLETRPGIGTVVATLPESSKADRARLLDSQIEEIVVEAKKLGIEADEVMASFSGHWKRLSSRNIRESSDPEQGGRAKR